MSRKKMINFDSESYLSQFKKKTKKKEEDCFQRMAKLTNVQSETVRGWFRANRIPEVEKTILDVYLESGKKMKKVLPATKKEEELPLVEMCEKAIISVDGEVVEEVPIIQCEPGDWTVEERENCPFPKALFFIKHAYDYDFTGDERCAYLHNLAQVVLREEVY